MTAPRPEWWRWRRESPAIDREIDEDGRSGRALRHRHLQSSEKGLCSGGCGICEGAGRQAEDRQPHLRYRRLFCSAQECGKTSGGGRGRRRLGAARSAREILPGRSVDSARREARGSGKIVKGLSATCADEFRLPAPVGRALLARAAAREPEESGRSAQRISGRVEVERQVQAGPGSAEAARKRLSEVFRNVNAHTRSSRGGRGRLARK